MIYLDRDEHGGGCCGVNHLYGFPDLDDMEDSQGRKPSLKDKIEAIEYQMNPTLEGETLEVVLTRQQSKIWERALFRCGFKRVLEFSNPNTSNILRMYLSTQNIVKPVKRKKGN